MGFVAFRPEYRLWSNVSNVLSSLVDRTVFAQKAVQIPKCVPVSNLLPEDSVSVALQFTCQKLHTKSLLVCSSFVKVKGISASVLCSSVGAGGDAVRDSQRVDG